MEKKDFHSEERTNKSFQDRRNNFDTSEAIDQIKFSKGDILRAQGAINQLMDKTTYLIGKCAMILGSLLVQDMEKINLYGTAEKLNKFYYNTMIMIERKVAIHLSKNRTLEHITAVNLNNPMNDNFLTDKPEESFLCYYIDGLQNFYRKIPHFTVVCALFEKGEIKCITNHLPMFGSTLWKQNSDYNIYENNKIVSKEKSDQFTVDKSYRQVNQMVDIFFAMNCFQDYIVQFNRQIIPCAYGSLFYTIKLVLERKIDCILINSQGLNIIKKKILQHFLKENQLSITEKDSYWIISQFPLNQNR